MDTSTSSKLFLYTGQSNTDIPRNVTHVKVDPSVKEIGNSAFYCCSQLIRVDLCEGLKLIAQYAFRQCTSLDQIAIPSTVKEIGESAFWNCTQLMNVDLSEHGMLELIDHYAFAYCTSLTSIIIPSTVKKVGRAAFELCSQLIHVELPEGLKRIARGTFFNCLLIQRIAIPSTVEVIGSGAFSGCSQLRNVELCEGLEQIDELAFEECTSLRHIRIPSTVKYIHNNSFEGCTSLVAIEFCEEIEQFVNEVSIPWWNHGVSETSLRLYSFLARRNIPARLDTLKVQMWKINIHDMLRRIPENDLGKEEKEGKCFDSIESRLANYEHLQEVAPFFELALWKAKVTEQQSNGSIIISNVENDVKLMCRVDSFSMFAIIFPNVFSFLSGDV